MSDANFRAKSSLSLAKLHASLFYLYIMYMLPEWARGAIIFGSVITILIYTTAVSNLFFFSVAVIILFENINLEPQKRQREIQEIYTCV